MKIQETNNIVKPVFMRPGHPNGEVVEAAEWRVIKEQKGLVELEAHLPDRLVNPFGQLFGGFTGIYVDMVSIYTVRTLYVGQPGYVRSHTINMRVDYLQPVLGPTFRLRGQLIKDGRSTCLIATSILDSEENLLVYALATLHQQFDKQPESTS